VDRRDAIRPGEVVAVVAALAAVGLALPLWLSWHFGALGLPRNDDWSYLLTLFTFADHGVFTSYGWATINLLGQLVMSTPVVWVFGHSVTAVEVQVAVVGLIGLVVIWILARLVLSPLRAATVALLVALGPMWAALSVSYLTDIPGMAVAMTCLLLGALSVRQGRVRPWLFVGAVAVGFVGFSIREYEIVAPLAVIAVAAWIALLTRRGRALVLLATAGLVVAAAVLYVWRTSAGLPGHNVGGPFSSVVPSSLHIAQTELRFTLLLGILVSPAVALARPWVLLRAAVARARWLVSVVGIAGLVVFGVELADQWNGDYILGPGNYVLANGLLGNDLLLVGHRPEMLPHWLLVILAVVGSLSAVILLCVGASRLPGLARRVRAPAAPTGETPVLAVVAMAGLGYACTCSLPLLLGQGLFDRYMLPLVPLVAIGVLVAGRAGARDGAGAWATAAVGLAGLGLIGAGFAANSASMDGIAWRLDNQAAAVVGRPALVNGAFVWNSYTRRTVSFSPLRTCAILVPTRTEKRPDTVKLKHWLVIASSPVWGPTGTDFWLTMYQHRTCPRAP
jgi:hypothetical protein